METEQEAVVRVFAEMLKAPTGDGKKKRDAGTKPPWYQDDAHEAAIFSHLTKWKRGELVDPDSGAHPLVHAAWRMLAIAYRETYGSTDPRYSPSWMIVDDHVEEFLRQRDETCDNINCKCDRPKVVKT